MAGSNLRFVVTIASIFVLAGVFGPCSAAFGAGPITSPPSGTDRDPSGGRPRRVEEVKSIGVDRQLTSFAGTVLDVGNRPVPNVEVKLFIGGQLAGSATSDGNGYYDLRAAYDPSDDVTVLLWFVAADRSLMPKELVIHESKASQANGLISKCVPRATVSPGHEFRIYLFDPVSRNKELAESECLP